MSSGYDQTKPTPLPTGDERERERLCDLELRSLLAEQARQQVHRLRTPLSVIKLITETLQLDLIDDRVMSERLRRLLGSVATLSAILTDAVQSTRFGDEPQRRVDAIAVAAAVVRVFGGRFSPNGGDSNLNDGRQPDVLLVSDSFEAALVHVLRLIGARVDIGAVSSNRPVLEYRQSDGRLCLHLSIEGTQQKPAIPGERADLHLMALAAKRMAEDCGGVLTIADGSASFELPLAIAIE